MWPNPRGGASPLLIGSTILLLLAAGCGQAPLTPAKTAAPAVRATVSGGHDLALDLPAQSVVIKLELQPALNAQALPSTADTVVVTLTRNQLAGPFTQTIQASQFIANTAQVVLSGLNAGTYHLKADVKNAGGNILTTAQVDIGVVSGQSTNASLVLIYGDPPATGAAGYP